MCLPDDVADLLSRARQLAERSLRALLPADEAAALLDLLVAGEPLVAPAPAGEAGTLTAVDLVTVPPARYGELVARCLQDPRAVGDDPELARLAAECSVAALRRDEVLPALSMLFLASVLDRAPSDPALEVLDHVLHRVGRDGRPGLLAIGLRNEGAGRDGAEAAHRAASLAFAAALVQLVGTWAVAAAAARSG